MSREIIYSISDFFHQYKFQEEHSDDLIYEHRFCIDGNGSFLSILLNHSSNMFIILFAIFGPIFLQKKVNR